jgi:hypothetical protein
MHNSVKFNFVPRTRETIERLINRYRSLTAQQWLHRTPVGPDEPFTGTLVVHRRFGKKICCDISFYDSPGETLAHIQGKLQRVASQTLNSPFQSADESWIHRDELFAKAIKCQHLLLFVDPNCRDIYDYVAAIHVLADALPRNQDLKVRKTVAIVFSKSDLLTTQAQRREVQQRAAPLVAACERVVHAHKTFFVSSTGRLVNEVPPSPLEPENLLAPIEWCLSQKLS